MGHHPGSARRGRAFTFIELVIVVLVLAIAATVALGAFADVDATQRADRAGQELATAFRYARMRAMSTGYAYGVSVSATGFAVVYQTVPGGPWLTESNPLGGGSYRITLADSSLLAGSAITPPAGVTQPMTYRTTGSRSVGGTATITISCGGRTCRVTVPPVGEPTVQ